MTVLESLMLVHVFDVRVSLEKEGNELSGLEGVAGQLGRQRAANSLLLHAIVFRTICIDVPHSRSETVLCREPKAVSPEMWATLMNQVIVVQNTRVDIDNCCVAGPRE